jgi:Tol biopolymer transport system component
VASTDLYEPSLSPDGRLLAYTTLAGGASEVFVRDLRSGVARQVSTGGEAWEPVLGHGSIAYTQGARVVVRDLRSGASVAVALPGAALSEPSLSADGKRVAFTARGAGDGNTSVYVRDLATGATLLVSRASGAAGPPAMGASSHPSLSADGQRVAFTSDAWNLSASKCNPARGIFVRDLAAASTVLVSRGDGENQGFGPTKGSGGADAMRVRLLCAV